MQSGIVKLEPGCSSSCIVLYYGLVPGIHHHALPCIATKQHAFRNKVYRCYPLVKSWFHHMDFALGINLFRHISITIFLLHTHLSLARKYSSNVHLVIYVIFS
jgi:hypothetical protein